MFLEFAKEGIRGVVILWIIQGYMYRNRVKGRIKLWGKLELLKTAIYFRFVKMQGIRIGTSQMLMFKNRMGEFRQ